MDRKICVSICSGTACFVMGASDLLLLEESLPQSLRPFVEIDGSTCLGFCRDRAKGKAPFVLIDGELMTEATLPKIIARVRELVDAES